MPESKKKPEARKMLENRADRASELQASIAQPKRVSAWHPQRPVHIILALAQDALLGGFWIGCNSIINLCDGISLNSTDSGFSCLGKD